MLAKSMRPAANASLVTAPVSPVTEHFQFDATLAQLLLEPPFVHHTFDQRVAADRGLPLSTKAKVLMRTLLGSSAVAGPRCVRGGMALAKPNKNLAIAIRCRLAPPDADVCPLTGLLFLGCLAYCDLGILPVRNPRRVPIGRYCRWPTPDRLGRAARNRPVVRLRWSPYSARRQWRITAMRSASRMVASRWAMMIAVRPRKAGTGALDASFGVVVHGRGGLVEHQYRGVTEVGARTRRASCRWPWLRFAPSGPDLGQVGMRQSFQNLVGTEFAHGGDDRSVLQGRCRQSQVVEDAAAEQDVVLQHGADLSAQVVLAQVAYIVAIDAHTPLPTS
jgi:hypothetical protein